MSEISVSISLDIRTCYAGHIYAVPIWVVTQNYQCPMCAAKRHEELIKELDERGEDQQRLANVIAGLRGALKRKK